MKQLLRDIFIILSVVYLIGLTGYVSLKMGLRIYEDVIRKDVVLISIFRMIAFILPMVFAGIGLYLLFQIIFSAKFRSFFFTDKE